MPFDPSKLKQLRAQHNVTQQDIADATGISRGNYGKKESGQVATTLDDLHKFAAFYNLEVEDFFKMWDRPSGVSAKRQKTEEEPTELLRTMLEMSKLILKLHKEIEIKNERVHRLTDQVRELKQLLTQQDD